MAGLPFLPYRSPSSLSTASTASASACINRLMDLTKCFYCLNQLKEARMLPCHHSFCSKCLLQLISSSTSKDEFLCPIDREVIKVPQFGINSFGPDFRARELEEIRNELEESAMLDEMDTSADIDINLESLNKGVKDIEHSSAMSQHAVNTMFEDIYKKLKEKQERLLTEIKRKSQRQIENLEFEKYRLIETKKFQNERFCDSSFYEEEINEPLRRNKDITESTPPSIASALSRPPNNVSTSSDTRLALISCHIGQQHLEFSRNDGTLIKLQDDLSNLGRITCDFDVKVKLERNLSGLGEYPFGMKVGGVDKNLYDWIASQPKGLSKKLASRLLIANSERNEVILLDNSFNVKRVIHGDDLFKSVTDVTEYGNNIFVADEIGCQVVMLNFDGAVVKRFGKMGVGNLELKRPGGITTDSRGRVIVADSLNHRIKILSPDLQKCVLTIVSDRKKYKEAVKFSFPCGVSVDADDNIYVTDTNNKRIVQLTRDGKFMKEIFPPDYRDLRCVAVSSDNKLLVTDRENGQLLVCDGNGQSMCHISGIMDSQGKLTKFRQPYGVIIDGTDKIIVTDIELNSVFVL